MSRVLYFDCFSGAAGDMVLGALLDAGLPRDALDAALGSLGVDHALVVTRVTRSGLTATHVRVEERGSARKAPAPAGAHAHHHGAHGHHHHDDGAAAHHHHRSLPEILRLIEGSGLTAEGKARAGAMFQRLAEAEAAIHGIPVEQVHLHEVGALDSIIDIVGAVFALGWFGVDEFAASPLNVGGGTVTIAHGTFPVPAPATLRLLAGVPTYGSDLQAELVTPTGALVVSSYATQYGPLPAMTVERVGYGAGTRELPGRPNVLRVVIGERLAERSGVGAAADVVQIECEIDDMNPQLFGPVTDRLFAAGALDAFLTPIVMKKGRPGTLLTVLAEPGDRAALSDIIFRETTTLGVRYATRARDVLEREWEEVAVEGGVVRMKIARRNGALVNAAPEFDDCVRLAEATGLPVKLVQAEVLQAWKQRSQK